MCESQGITDRVLAEAAAESGLRYSELRLPTDLCVWVDPKSVACRFGDELGSFLPIYSNEGGDKKSYIDRFDFHRLCEKTSPGPVNIGRQSASLEKAYTLRVSESQYTMPTNTILTPSKFSVPNHNSPSTSNRVLRRRPLKIITICDPSVEGCPKLNLGKYCNDVSTIPISENKLEMTDISGVTDTGITATADMSKSGRVRKNKSR